MAQIGSAAYHRLMRFGVHIYGEARNEAGTRHPVGEFYIDAADSLAAIKRAETLYRENLSESPFAELRDDQGKRVFGWRYGNAEGA